MMRWEYLKYKVREFSKQYSVDKAKERKAKRNKLELRVKELEVLISSNAEETVIQEYHDCKYQLNEIIITLHKVLSYVLELTGMNMEKNLLNIFFILKRETRQNLI